MALAIDSETYDETKRQLEQCEADCGRFTAKIESDAKVIAALREASTETLAALDALEVGDGNTRLSAAMAKLRTAANEQNVGESK